MSRSPEANPPTLALLRHDFRPEELPSGPEPGFEPNAARANKALIAMDAMSDGVITIDLNLAIVFMNPAAERLTGWSSEQAVNRPISSVLQIVNSRTRETGWAPFRAVLDDDEQSSLLPDSNLIRKDGVEIPIEDSISPVHDGAGRVVGATITFRDSSFTRVMLLKSLHQAHHDPLTNLPNRMLFEDRIAQALTSIEGRPHKVALLFLDLDNFKEINDSLGHASGDAVLRAVAKKLNSIVRGSDTVCRLGGDEFVVLLPEVDSIAEVTSTAKQILKAIQMPIFLNGMPLRVSASMGVVIRKHSHADGNAMLRDSDSAMYAAKQAGGNQLRVFASDMEPQAFKSVTAQDGLLKALEREEFMLYYQPQVDLQTGRIVGAEALLRWKTSDGKLLSPSAFIPIAEQSDLIKPIGQWVFREAARQQRLWSEEGFGDLTVCTNVSSVELQQEEYLAALDSILKQETADPNRMVLELTESVLLMQAEQESPVLAAARKRGLQLAIDDFGTGYSSLSYLRRFPFNIIKIDKSFVANCTTRAQDASILKAMIGLGRSLHKTVIAEGIEKKEQAVFLAELGCDQGQGFYFSTPVPAAVLSKLLAKEHIDHWLCNDDSWRPPVGVISRGAIGPN